MKTCLMVAMLISGAAASVSSGQVFIRVLDSELAASSRAEVHVMPTPLVMADDDSDVTRPFPSIQTQASVGGASPFQPRASSVSSGSARLLTATSISLNTQASFDLQSSTIASPPTRVAAGSWRQYVQFEIRRSARVDLSINPRLFDELSYDEYTPGTLTGPDGVVVSGSPTPGASSWIWQRTLKPGVYTFEASADFEVAHDGTGRLSDAVRHDVVLSTRPLACLADFDGDGELTIFDFLLFQNLFDSGASEADVDDDGSLTIFDFLAFQNLFDAGCP